MTATIHHCEIFAWQKRQLAGEIYITGMAASTKGYVLTYMETPGMKPLNNLSGSRVEGCHERDASAHTTPQMSAMTTGDLVPAGSNPASPTTLGTPVPPVPLAVPAPVAVPPLPESISATLVICPACGAEIPECEDCTICEKMEKIAKLARANRRDYAIKMSNRRADKDL